jgi:hypothetical protein
MVLLDDYSPPCRLPEEQQYNSHGWFIHSIVLRLLEIVKDNYAQPGIRK